MLFVCAHCGRYRDDQIIDPSGPYAICPECGCQQPFKYLPLMVVGGASGSGKSVVCRSLLAQNPDAVLLDSDILWRPEFNTPENHYREFFETWLRVCMNIHQSGRPVILFGAGFGVPENLESCVARRYFPRIYYHALVCAPAELEKRLRERPVWRGSAEPEFLEAQINFNHWLSEYNGVPNIRITDTTSMSIYQSTFSVFNWMSGVISNDGK